jgi:hypothetical protein
MARRASHEPHALLGVRRGANRDEITRAFRARARVVHPDVSGADTTTAMADLTAARDALLKRDPVEPAAPTVPTEPRERPGWAKAHGAAWTDHWAAWNEPRRPEDG